MDPALTDSPPPGASVAAPAPARPRGRRKWFIAGAAGLAVLMVAVFFRGSSVGRPATLTFVGFTNGVMSFRGTNYPIVEAWFWVTNGSQRARWHTCFVSAPKSGVLLDWRQTGRWVAPRLPGTNAPPSWYEPGEAVLLNLPVEEAQLPMRVMMLVMTPHGAVSGMRANLRRWYEMRVRGMADCVPHWEFYSVTNEFHPKP
jgi:hypothetical protein